MNSEEKECLNAKAELRARIIDAAGTLFIANGIKCIKMDDIASAVGISKRTLYEVFEDKEMLLCECIKREQASKCEFFEAVVADSKHVLEVMMIAFERVITNLQNTHRDFFADLTKYKKAFAMLEEERELHAKNTVAFMQKGVEQGIFRSDVNLAIVFDLMNHQLNMLINFGLCNEYPLIEVYESIIVTTIRGISTVKGAEELEKFIVQYRKNKQL